MSILEILFIPGGFIGILLLRITCKLGINIESMCIFDHGSATSTGEHVFVRIGTVIFYGIILPLLFLYIRKRKIENHIQ